jgi:hypothetical protein
MEILSILVVLLNFLFCLFVYLPFYVPLMNFSLTVYGDVTIAGEGL